MTNCTSKQIEFPAFKNRRIIGEFTGGDVTSDGGSMLLRQVDRKVNLIKEVAKNLPDSRRQDRCKHSLVSMLRQRVYGIALGYEDLNDHLVLRKDPGFQTAVDQDSNLSSAPTLCRLENRADRDTAWAIQKVMIQQFITSFKRPPKELILDFDATDDAVHGKQEGRFFHGYYDHYCFLPLYVFCGEQLLVSYLRPSKIDGAKHAWAILRLLVKRLREAWPKVKIIVRADSGFCRHKMLSWCEREDVEYIIGIAKNKRILSLSASQRQKAEQNHEETGEKQRLFSTIYYAAGTWKRKRKIIVKAEHNNKGANPRFVITNIEEDEQTLYENLYCARGNMENRIKEQQLYLFADRTSCHAWYANQFRLLLSSLAYILIQTIRSVALQGTQLAKAQSDTIRLKLLKIGAVIIRNTRRVRFLLSSSYPYQDLFCKVAARLC
jgi:hypothetical protein